MKITPIDSAVLEAALSGLRTVFLQFLKSSGPGSLVFREHTPQPLIGTLYRVLELAGQPGNAVSANGPDVTDGLNALVALTANQTLISALEDAFFEEMRMRGIDLNSWLVSHHPGGEQLEFYRKQMLNVIHGIEALRTLDDPGCRLNPACRGCLGGDTILDSEPAKIVAVANLRDPFANGRTYQYYPDGRFEPVKLEGITDPALFFGYHGVRNNFAEHLGNFASGKSNVPLMVSSLPGLGKTRFSISYTLAEKDVTLVLADPETLSGGLNRLIALLQPRHRKFVIFFDDIEPDKINWYNFRTNVGGSGNLPMNICFIMASNYPFPVNILSRGREITFPIFDEIRCQEMVEDFLVNFGLKGPQENLASVIAASYVEDFAQKKFTELSPRTLARYLEQFKHDGSMRRHMLELSRQELIVRPDTQIFYEFNIKTLRTLYGESYIDELREEKLKAMGKQ